MNKPVRPPSAFERAILEEPEPGNVVGQLMMDNAEIELHTISHQVEIMRHLREIPDIEGYVRVGGQLLDQARKLAKKLKDMRQFGIPAAYALEKGAQAEKAKREADARTEAANENT